MAFNHKKGLCCVNHKDKLIFIGVSSNASTSVRNAINVLEYSDNYLSFLEGNAPEKYYTTFAIIRDPIERLISGYIKVCARATQDSPHILKKKFYWERNQKKRFYEFIDELERDYFDCHIEKQIFFLTDNNDDMLNINYLLKLEHIDKDFSKMCKDLGLNYNLGHLNKGYNKNTNAIKLKVFKRYSKKIFNCQNIKNPYSFVLLKIINKIKNYFNKRPLPSKNKISLLIHDDSNLLRRIRNIYRDDIVLYEKAKSKPD